jgi:hypothetical protein
VLRHSSVRERRRTNFVSDRVLTHYAVAETLTIAASIPNFIVQQGRGVIMRRLNGLSVLSVALAGALYAFGAQSAVAAPGLTHVAVAEASPAVQSVAADYHYHGKRYNYHYHGKYYNHRSYNNGHYRYY